MRFSNTCMGCGGLSKSIFHMYCDKCDPLAKDE